MSLPEIPVAAPPRVADRIAGAPDGAVAVLHACAGMVHLELPGVGPGRVVGVGSAAAAGLPHALRTTLESLPLGRQDPPHNLPTRPGEMSSQALPTAYVESGILYLGGRALVARRLVGVRAPRLDAVRIPKASPVAAMGTPRPRGAGLVAGPDCVDAGRVVDLVGRGEGLTPWGDDVLCGWLVARRAAGVPTPEVDAAVRQALPRTTALSATLLECAMAGEAADLVLAYLIALGAEPGTGSRPVIAAGSALRALGHSSGAGLAHGVDLALGRPAGRTAA
ncbi:MAG TPA: DUF2877 domain-containing protein [Nocardioides sp.]|uniref:oxamate carbamoyltransferase subunit AllH family protein n=1 Tax=Nocardioides sp. TaxID=35761 RepID=UPI002E347A2E|nr:DUF2877 domain-containing protein [Nocardioides sp.]HEX3929130.1 DUF2877 domain-containing protein [Nocardioides sp.]